MSDGLKVNEEHGTSICSVEIKLSIAIAASSCQNQDGRNLVELYYIKPASLLILKLSDVLHRSIKQCWNVWYTWWLIFNSQIKILSCLFSMICPEKLDWICRPKKSSALDKQLGILSIGTQLLTIMIERGTKWQSHWRTTMFIEELR